MTMSSVIARIKSMNWRNALADPWPFTAAWVLAGFLAIIVPVIKWSKEKSEYYSNYGYYIDYENQQNDSGDNDNDNENNNYYYKECSWFNWPCRKQQYIYAMSDGDGNNDNNNVQIPNWYLFLGGETEQTRRWEEENTGRRGGDSSPSAAEKFVYAWTLIMFAFILAYGVYVLFKRQAKTSLVVILLLFAQFCLMNMVLVSQGVISTDDRDLEDSVYGWYGQMGVLMTYTDFWLMLFCIIFSIAFGIRAFLERRNGNKTSADQKEEEEATSEYQKYDAPTVELA